MAALETRLGQREEELGRVSASKEKLVSMVTSLQAALRACEIVGGLGVGGGRGRRTRAAAQRDRATAARGARAVCGAAAARGAAASPAAAACVA